MISMFVLKVANIAIFWMNCECNISIRILDADLKYSMHDLICDVISLCAWSCDTGNISAGIHDKISKD